MEILNLEKNLSDVSEKKFLVQNEEFACEGIFS